jgi:hypothetical protein
MSDVPGRRDEPRPEDDRTARLVCAGCHHTPRPSNIVWSYEDQCYIHTKTRTSDLREGFPIVCGGKVIPRGDTWLTSLRAGSVVRCVPPRGSRHAHLVRLGLRANARNSAWSGTSLCAGETQHHRWIPVDPRSRLEYVDCEACARLARTRAPEPQQ